MQKMYKFNNNIKNPSEPRLVSQRPVLGPSLTSRSTSPEKVCNNRVREAGSASTSPEEGAAVALQELRTELNEANCDLADLQVLSLCERLSS